MVKPCVATTDILNVVLFPTYIHIFIVSVVSVTVMGFFTVAAHSIPDHNSTLSDCILKAVLALLPKEVPEHGRNLLQYFDLFIMYMNFGTTQVCCFNAHFAFLHWLFLLHFLVVEARVFALLSLLLYHIS